MEYEQPEYEPQEHDELAVKVLELIKGEVSAKIGETVNSLEHYKKNEKRLYQQISELNSKIRNNEAELKKSLLAKEKDVIRELFGGLARGDKAFYVDYKYESTVCIKCNGSGKVVALIDGEELKVKCPVCEGQGSKGSSHFIVKEGKVETVSLEINEYAKHLNFYFVNRDSKASGDSVFKTIEECQVCCDEKNKPKEVKK